MNPSKLKFWIDHNYNVLFTGKRGVGKSTMIIDAFNGAGLKWMYFSASTMDPWVDFIGVPREVKDEKGNSYLDLIRPKAFQDDEVEALFFDEYNRSHPKIRNAVMELIQFKSINGKKFKNLRFVWAAINPEDQDETTGENNYDVEKLDPAQKDRFHIQVEIPYKPSLDFFKNHFGERGEVAVGWWNSLDITNKDLVSPRRLEYVVKVFNDGGDIRDVLPNQINTSELVRLMSNSSSIFKMEKIYKEKSKSDAKAFITDANNWRLVQQSFDTLDKKHLDFWCELVPSEYLSQAISENTKVGKYVLNEAAKNSAVWAENICKEIYLAKTNEQVGTRIEKEYKKNNRNTPKNWSINSVVKNPTEASILQKISDLSESDQSNSFKRLEVIESMYHNLSPQIDTLDVEVVEKTYIEILKVLSGYQAQTLTRGLLGAYKDKSVKVIIKDSRDILKKINNKLQTKSQTVYTVLLRNNWWSLAEKRKLTEWMKNVLII